jgi:DNA ligase-1
MIKPMLAHKLDESRIDWAKPVYMQPKLDGVRCLFTKDGAFSRTGKQFMNVKHIEKMLKPFFKACPWTILDGELYNHELKNDFEKIISLVRKQKPTDEDRSEAHKMIQYHVYDYIHEGNEGGLSYSNRLDNLTTSDIYCWSVQYVETKRVATPAMSKVIHQENLDKGYEGSILRTDTPYKHGRSFGLMKFKDFSDTEATIVNYEEGKGKRTGTLGKFIMQDDDGNIFGCPPGKGYTYGDLKCMLKNIHQYMGQRATFTYFQRTKAGSYRHPLFKTLRNYE